MTTPLLPRITKAQSELLLYLNERPGELMACERVCHPNTAAALERRGLLTIEDGDGGFRPWFDARITKAGRQALQAATASPIGVGVSQDEKSPRITAQVNR